MKKLRNVLPEFTDEVESLLRFYGYADVADQLADLEVARWTHDPEVDASSIALAGQRPINIVEQNIIGVRNGQSIDVGHPDAIVVVDVDNFNRPTSIEVIGTKGLLDDLKRIDSSGQ